MALDLFLCSNSTDISLFNNNTPLGCYDSGVYANIYQIMMITYRLFINPNSFIPFYHNYRFSTIYIVIKNAVIKDPKKPLIFTNYPFLDHLEFKQTLLKWTFEIQLLLFRILGPNLVRVPIPAVYIDRNHRYFTHLMSIIIII